MVLESEDLGSSSSFEQGVVYGSYEDIDGGVIEGFRKRGWILGANLGGRMAREGN